MLLGVIGIVGQETASLGGVGAIFPDSGFGNSLMMAAATTIKADGIRWKSQTNTLKSS